jgi:Asp-tRNA(Asn)/Glu-tRNA(Gln) amidotransferase A subunit family amidase
LSTEGNPDNALLRRLESELTWPPWEDYRAYGQLETTPIARTDYESIPYDKTAITESLRQAEGLERALSRAKLVADGGAYTRILATRAQSYVDSESPPISQAPLKGFFFAVKDLVAVAEQPLRAGSAVRSGADPEPFDAPIVQTLRCAGAILIGLTALHEFAFGVTGVNGYTGTPANPHDSERVPGGSSSGSAVAVAEGSARVAVGTDTGGSVRIPAALCGVVGFKPRYGSYPVAGIFPLAPTLDHAGILARSVADIRAVHVALGHHAPQATAPVTIGVSRAELEACEAVVRQKINTVLRALADHGPCRIVEVEWPDPQPVFSASTAIMFSEAAAIHRQHLKDNAEQYGSDVRQRLRTGLAIPAASYVNALHIRQRLSTLVEVAFTQIDLFLGPTVGILAPTFSEANDPAVAGQLVAHTRLANLTGIPAISLPMPGDGLPVGLQLTALSDASLLGAAAFVEALINETFR